MNGDHTECIPGNISERMNYFMVYCRRWNRIETKCMGGVIGMSC